ncbi:MAG: right-handed parallel beta-helix repeat-containing protein [Halobacteriaceae archaeon]
MALPARPAVLRRAVPVLACLLVGVALLALATGGAAAQPTQITGCAVVDSPGVYELTANVTDSTASTCIDVSASDVVLDGAGHVVDGVGSGTSMGVRVSAAVDLTNVTVRNLTVAEWGSGVYTNRAPNTTIASVTASGNDVGVKLGRVSQHARLVDVHATGNAEWGVVFGNAPNATLAGSVLANNHGGVRVAGLSDGVTVRNTTVTGGAHWAVMAGDDALNVTVDGLVLDTATVSGSLDAAALRAEPAPPAAPAGSDGVGQSVNASATAAGGTLNLTFHYADAAASGVTESDLRVHRHDGGWSVVAGSTADPTANAVPANVTSLPTVPSVLAPFEYTGPVPVDDCFTVTQPGVYALTNDITTTEDVCVDVQADDVTLHGNGHRITGDMGAAAVRAQYRTNVTVTDLAVRNWTWGVSAFQSDDVRVSGLLANASSGAVRLYSTTDSVAEDVRAANTTVEAIYIDGSGGEDLRIRNLTVRDATAAGLLANYADNVSVRNSTFRNVSGGLLYGVGARNATVADVTVDLRQGTGISLKNADGATVRRTTVANGTRGVLVRHTDGVTLRNVTVTGATDEGVLLDEPIWGYPDTANNTVIDSTLVDNGWEVVATGSTAATAGENVTLGTATVAFTGSGFRLGEETAPPPDPTGHHNLSAFVTAGGGGSLDLSVHYASSAPASANVSESSLALFRHDGSWGTLPNSTVDPAADVVSGSLNLSGGSPAVLAPMGGSGPAQPGVCRDVTHPGVHHVNGSVTTDEAVCIEVLADDVVIDGAGHTIASNRSFAAADAAVRAVGVDNVTVRNLTTTGWEDGVELADGSGLAVLRTDSVGDLDGVHLGNATGARVEGVTAAGSESHGVYLAGGVDGAVLENVVVLSTDGDAGVRVDGSSGVVVRGLTTLNATGGNGLEVHGATDLLVRNLVASNNSLHGAAVRTSQNVTLRNVTTESNAYNGVFVYDTTGATVRTSRTRGNGQQDLLVGFGAANVSVDRVSVGSGRASFPATAGALLRRAGSSPPTLSNVTWVGRAVGFSPPAQSTPLRLHYNASSVAGMAESTLRLWHSSGQTSGWVPVPNSTVNQSANTVAATYPAGAAGTTWTVAVGGQSPGTWYEDADGDGFGTAAVSKTNLTQPAGYVANDDDCDDADATVHPNATETANGVDDDCDGTVDEGVTTTTTGTATTGTPGTTGSGGGGPIPGFGAVPALAAVALAAALGAVRARVR